MRTVYAPLKVFGFPGHLGPPEAGIRAPVHLRIKPINACNHGCWFCAYRSHDLSLGAEMDLKDRIPSAKMEELVEDAIAMGVRAVTFSGGGEPLLYPGIGAIVRRLAEGGVRVGVLTNGTYLRDETADALADAATWVRVSMDGWDDESYARLRKTKPGEFERISGNIAAFAARTRRAAIGLSFIVHPENAPHLYEYCTMAKRWGVGHVKVSPCVVSDSGATNIAYHRSTRPLVREHLSRAMQLNDANFSVVDHYHTDEASFEKPYRTCPMLEFLTVIGADCSVYTCQDKAYTDAGRLGSIRDRSFRSFWFSEENRQAVAALDPSIACRHHCVSDEKNRLLLQYRSIEPEHRFFV